MPKIKTPRTMTIKEIIDAERYDIERGEMNADWKYLFNAALDRVENAVTKYITKLKGDNSSVLDKVLTGTAKRFIELEEHVESRVESAYKQGYDSGYANRFL